MTAYHVAQLVLAAVALAVIAERVRALLFRAALPLRPFERVLLAVIRGGDRARARALAEAARPAWVGEVAALALDAREGGLDPGLALEEHLLGLRYEASRGLWALRVLASLGSASGVLGALWELLRLLGGHTGLAGLMAGLAERLAFERALLALLLGAAVAVVSLHARAVLARQSTRLVRDVRGLADRLVEALAPAGEPAAAERPPDAS